MSKSLCLIVFPVQDIETAKTLYTAFLGVEPYADSPYYVGYKAENIEIGLDPHAQQIVSYTDVDDMQVAIETMKAAGGELHVDAKQVGPGLTIAQVKDVDGNVLGLRHQEK